MPICCRELGADVALVGLIDGVKLEVDHHLAAAVDQVGEGEIDVGQSLLRGADDEGARALVDGKLFHIEDIANDVTEFVHLLTGHAGDVDGLLQLTFEALAILRGVFCDDYAFGIERDSKEMHHVEQDGHGLLVRRVVEIEANILPLHGVIEVGTNAVTGEDLSDDVLFLCVKMKALRTGVGKQRDRAGDSWRIVYPGLYLRMKDLGERAGVNALADDVVLLDRGGGLQQGESPPFRSGRGGGPFRTPAPVR